MVGAVPVRRRSRSKSGLRAVVLVLAILLSACAEGVVLPESADEELITGLEIYESRCARCHGRDGGGGIGLNLQQVEAVSYTHLTLPTILLV